jgi:hypothetical protein
VALCAAAASLAAVPAGASTPDFSTAKSYAVEEDPASVAAADFNGDGGRDLAVANQDSDTVSVLKNRGDGGFAKARDHAVGVSPNQVVANDLTGDGRPDLAVANRGSEDGVSSTVSVLKNRGGAFAKAVDYEVGLFAYSVAAADLDGDGDRDLAVDNFSDGKVSVLPNRRGGAFGKAEGYRAGRYPTDVVAADLGGSGRPDLAVVNSGPDTVSVLINAARGRPAGRSRPPAMSWIFRDRAPPTWDDCLSGT